MKELESHNLLPEKQGVESVEQKQQEIELTFLGDLKPLKGHRLWEINNSNLEIKEAQYNLEERITWWEALKAFENPQISVVKDVIIKPNHTYISALNKANALIRYKEGKGSAEIPKSNIDIKLF